MSKAKSNFVRRTAALLAATTFMACESPQFSFFTDDLKEPGKCRPSGSYYSSGHSRATTDNDYAHKSKVKADRRKKNKAAKKAKRKNRRK